MGGHRVPNKGKNMTVGISSPAKGCLTSHNRSEINKMKVEESEYKTLDDAASHGLHQTNVSVFC